jgi:hypothetical protein
MSGTTDEISFTDPNGVVYDFTITVSNVDGTGDVTAISGTAGGEAITGLNDTLGHCDNIVESTTAPQFDESGLSFNTGDDSFNLYDNNGALWIFDSNDTVAGYIQNEDFTVGPLCYLRGTHILTPTGEVLVEDLRIGDRVVTRFGGIQAVKWIGRQSYDCRFLQNNPAKLPVRVKAGALGQGLPARDLLVSPGHAMLLGDSLVLASSLVNDVTITREKAAPEDARIDYFQPELDAHDCIIAEGTWSETFADGPGLRAAYHNAAEFHALYPSYQTPDEIRLCAPRPERGAALEALLRPVVDRAAGKLVPGPLDGSLDRVTGQVVEGWACDADHPDMPVLVEVLLGGAVIHQGLACDFRADLQRAGYANGRCAFFFTLPQALPAEVLPLVSVRRAADEAALPVSEGCEAARQAA